MSEVMSCKVVNPERLVFDEGATFVVLPGAAGEMGVYAKHAPLVTTLGMGVVKAVLESGEEVRVAVSGGYAEVDGESVIVLAMRAVPVSEISIERAERSVESIQAVIDSLEPEDPGLDYQKDKLEWVKMLLRLAGQ